VRKKVWLVKSKRDKWTPTPSSKLCEVHFAADQFTIDPSGKKKLKWDAVPTLFNHSKPIKERKEPTRTSTNEFAGSDSFQVDSNVDEENIGSECTDQHQSQQESGIQSARIPLLDVSNVQENCVPLQASKKPRIFVKGVNIYCPQECHETTLCLKQKVTQQQQEISSLKSSDLQKENRLLKKKLEAANKKNLLLTKSLRRTNLERNKLKYKRPEKRKAGRRCNRWTKDEIKRALQLKLSCNTGGYTTLLKQGYELPSISTLYKHTENFAFEPGVLHEVFDLLAAKVKHLNEHERKCAMTLDEMSLKPGWNYDVKTGSCYGDVTLPNHSGAATHALVFMIGGLATHWKQALCYHFTPNSVDGAVFTDIVKQLVIMSKSIGLDVLSCTSDMGSSNLKMWK